MNIFTPKGFLQVGGVILIVVGLLGMIGIIGPTPESSIFGEAWWFDGGENVVHLLLGIVALAAAYILKDMGQQKVLVILVGIIALLVGIIGFFVSSTPPNFLGANLENPADNILHLVIGVWALYAAMGGKKDMMMSPGPTTPAM